jgi:hypothetical protein
VERAKKICREIQGGVADEGSNMMAYLAMMAVRLIEMCRILKPAGSVICTGIRPMDAYFGGTAWCAAGTRNGDSGKPWRGIDPAARE